jgi:hypothetical protein
MSTAASAVAAVDSATTPEAPVVETPTAPATPAFDASDQHTWSSEQREEWNRTGEIPAAPKKETAAPDSAPDKDKKTAANASDSATDKTQKQPPHLKTKEDTETRIKTLLDKQKAQEAEVAELRKALASRDTKQVSQPAAAPPAVPGLKQFLTEYFAKPENANGKKSYEDGVEAWASARDTERAKQMEQQVRNQIASEAAQKALNESVAAAKQRYPDYEQVIQPAVAAITDESIPFPVRALINDSPVFTDLLYVLGQPEALKDLIHTAKTNPTAALRKITLTEQLVQQELAKGAKAKPAAAAAATDDAADGTGKQRDASGKFVSSEKNEAAGAPEPKPRAPKPPSEVGGRGTAPADELVAAAKANDFKSFEKAQWQRTKARVS